MNRLHALSACKLRSSAGTRRILPSWSWIRSRWHVDTIHQRLMASLVRGRPGAGLLVRVAHRSLRILAEYRAIRDEIAGGRTRCPFGGLSSSAEGLRGPRAGDATSAIDTRLARLAGDLLLSHEQETRHGRELVHLLPFEERSALMSEHARSGMAFAGRVTQLITVATGLDDWEWGVTLWSRNPQFLKDIVYRMRFDEASARYAEFGPFLRQLPRLRAEDPGTLSPCLTCVLGVNVNPQATRQWHSVRAQGSRAARAARCFPEVFHPSTGRLAPRSSPMPLTLP